MSTTDPFEAIRNKDIQTLTKLLDKGTLPNLRNGDDQTLLSYAASCNQIGAMELLLMRGANVNEPDVTNPALHSAVESPSSSIDAKAYVAGLELLIRHGADINARNKAQMTPLELAIIFKRPMAVKCLLEHNAAFNPKAVLNTAEGRKLIVESPSVLKEIRDLLKKKIAESSPEKKMEEEPSPDRPRIKR